MVKQEDADNAELQSAPPHAEQTCIRTTSSVRVDHERDPALISQFVALKSVFGASSYDF